MYLGTLNVTVARDMSTESQFYWHYVCYKVLAMYHFYKSACPFSSSLSLMLMKLILLTLFVFDVRGSTVMTPSSVSTTDVSGQSTTAKNDPSTTKNTGPPTTENAELSTTENAVPPITENTLPPTTENADKPVPDHGDISTDKTVPDDRDTSTHKAATDDGDAPTDKPVPDDGDTSTDKPITDDGDTSTDKALTVIGDIPTVKSVPDDGDTSTDKPVPDDGDTSTDKLVPNDGDTSTDKPVPDDGDTSTDKAVPDDGDTSTDKPVPDDGDTSTDKPITDDGDTSIDKAITDGKTEPAIKPDTDDIPDGNVDPSSLGSTDTTIESSTDNEPDDLEYAPQKMELNVLLEFNGKWCRNEEESYIATNTLLTWSPIMAGSCSESNDCTLLDIKCLVKNDLTFSIEFWMQEAIKDSKTPGLESLKKSAENSVGEEFVINSSTRKRATESFQLIYLSTMFTVVCLAGSSFDETTNTCYWCSPGTYFHEGDCLECKVDTFQAECARNECKPCEVNYNTAGQTGQASCTLIEDNLNIILIVALPCVGVLLILLVVFVICMCVNRENKRKVYDSEQLKGTNNRN